ncbi:MAG: hypothetical protein V4864_16635 [Pseudomonadota bacterium]
MTIAHKELFASQPARQTAADAAPRPIRIPTQREAAMQREAAARRAREQLCREGWHTELAKALIGEIDKRRERLAAVSRASSRASGAASAA